MKAQDLKNSILQLAMEGKLLPQNPTDEPANIFLKNLKDFSIKSDIYKKNGHYYEKIGKKEPVCIDDEINFDIPDTWVLSRLDNLCKLNGGFAFKSNEFKESGVRVIRISDFDENGFKNNRIVYYDENDDLNKFILEDNDILMAMTGGTVGKSLLVKGLSEKMYVNQRVADIKIINGISVEYIYFVLQSAFIKKIIHKNKNSTNDNISMKVIRSFLIPIPPINEQNRIVNKIKELMNYVNEYEDLSKKLDNLNNNFPFKLKNSILQEAVQGNLVPQDPNDELSSILLDKIKKEKEKLIKAKKIKRNNNESIIYSENGHFYETSKKETVCIDNEIPFDIPDSWEWTRIKNISEFVTKGTTPRGGKSAYKDEGIKFLRVENIGKKGELILDNIKYIDDDTHNNFLKRSILEENDLLISIAGALGRTAIVPNNVLPLNTNQAVSFVRWFNTDLIHVPFIEKAINSPEIQKLLLKQSKVTAIPNLTLEIIRECLIPIPPLNEQINIVNEIEMLFNYIDILINE